MYFANTGGIGSQPFAEGFETPVGIVCPRAQPCLQFTVLGRPVVESALYRRSHGGMDERLDKGGRSRGTVPQPGEPASQPVENRIRLLIKIGEPLIRRSQFVQAETEADIVELHPRRVALLTDPRAVQQQLQALLEFSVLAATVEMLEPWLVRIWPTGPAHNTLFELEDGRALVLPALRHFIATISFEDGELRNVAYEPSANTDRWQEYMAMKDELTTLRSLIAASADVGGFRLDRADALKLADRIRFVKGVDPTMALYAAYTYHNLGRRDLIRDMQRYLREGLQMTLFDVAMMASDKSVPREEIFPFAPLLAQGWSLIDAFGVDVSDGVSSLRRHVGTSLWTIYDKDAIPTLRTAMKGRQ